VPGALPCGGFGPCLRRHLSSLSSPFPPRLAARRRSIRTATRPPLPLRAILGISLLLLGVAMLSCRVESSGELQGSAKPQAAGVRWVRTVDGWERPDVWKLEAVGRPGLHPLVVAAGQGLLSVLGLVVFHREGR
jgi:hypothetical protein